MSPKSDCDEREHSLCVQNVTSSGHCCFELGGCLVVESSGSRTASRAVHVGIVSDRLCG
jgi:hypothetical protein